MTITIEKTYPIYYVCVRWSETLSGEDVASLWREGLSVGRMWNGTGWYIMERETRPTEEIAAEITRDWWPEYAAKRPKPDDMTITVESKGHDTWCSGWFSHWTFRDGRSDEEILDSFHRYVHRIQYSGRPESEIRGLLMNAEDHWRWYGCATGDPRGKRTEPPCNCPHCQEHGITRIDH